MPEATRNPGCGNSPKNALVQALAVAIETSNCTALARCISDDVVWALPGRRSLDGKAAAVAYLKFKGVAAKVARIHVRRVVSHGRAGAVDGTLILKSGLAHGFCHVVEFTSAKGQRITSICSYYSDVGDTEYVSMPAPGRQCCDITRDAPD